MKNKKKKSYYYFDIEYQRELRKEVITFLGGKCCNPNCLVPNGCSDIRCLQIDHINGISEEEPRLLGIELYDDILHNQNSKQKYQLLCANCNWIKRAEKNENRGYTQRLGQKQPLCPTIAHIGGCTNPNTPCSECKVTNCTVRLSPKFLSGLTDLWR